MAQVSSSAIAALRATVAWFAYFGRPTRKDEARKYLFQHAVSDAEWKGAREHLFRDPHFWCDGEYVVPVRGKAIVQQFRSDSPRRCAYLRRAERAARLLSHLPFVRLVGLINSLVMGGLKSTSDIDLFIITTPRRLYVVRTLALILLVLLGLKKTRTRIAGKICLGFFVTEDALDFEKENIQCDPVYLAFWLATLQPLAGEDGVYTAFMSQNVPFVHRYLPNFVSDSPPLPRFPIWQRISEFLFHGWIGEKIEVMLRHVHIRHTWKLPENHWPTATTIANERMLKLHAVDPTHRYREEWEAILDFSS